MISGLTKKQKEREENLKKDGKEQRIENQEHYIIKQEMINTLIEKTKRKYYNNALKNNKDPRMLNKNLDDLIGLKKEKVLPENNSNHMDLANRFWEIF